MRTLAAVLLFVGAALAGCVGGGPDRSAAPLAVEPEGDPLASDTLAANASLPVAAAVVDPWLPGETERVLFDGTVRTTDVCYGDIELDDGVRIPEGTRRLRVSADASDALKAGEYHFDLYSYGNRWNGGEAEVDTAEKVHEWNMGLGPQDWDPSGHKRTGAWLSFECKHDNGLHVLDGAIPATVVAERDPAWIPVAAPDPWASLDQHRFPQDGVITLLDAVVTVSEPGRVERQTGATGSGPVALEDVIPPGTKHVVVAIKWSDYQGCPPAHECWVSTGIVSGGGWWKNDAGEGPDWKIYEPYKVPDDVAEDHPYVTTSVSRLEPFLYNCDPGCVVDSVGLGAAWTGSRSADVRFLVEAWHGDADLDAVKARLGVA